MLWTKFLTPVYAINWCKFHRYRNSINSYSFFLIENMNPVNKHQLLCRKPSLHPHHGPITPMSHVSDWLKNSESEVPYHRGRSHSLTFEQGQGGHPPLSPQSSITSSGSSDTHQDMEPMRNSFLEEGSGMRGQWGQMK